jgi:hypothetical protein
MILRRMRNVGKRAGFTLLEVLMAMGLFMFGISAMLGMFQFGGGMEATARTHAELAPAIQPLIRHVQEQAWIFDSAGQETQLRIFLDEPVPGVPGFRYALVVQPPGDNPYLRQAQLNFYRKNPARTEASVTFLLTQKVPVSRRLRETGQR